MIARTAESHLILEGLKEENEWLIIATVVVFGLFLVGLAAVGLQSCNREGGLPKSRVGKLAELRS